MSNITGVADGQVRSRILVAARRSVIIDALGAAALLGRALPVEAVALPQHPCTPELEQLCGTLLASKCRPSPVRRSLMAAMGASARARR
jgi:hypothetical protein